MSKSVLDYLDRIRFRFRREISRRMSRQLCGLSLSQPIISFTFDDFPRNAATIGGEILSQFQVSGTYYLSLGLAGTTAPTGQMFERSDLGGLLADGHELGCHTFDHLDAWETGPRVFAASLDRNQEELKRLFPGLIFQSMAYPVSCPNPSTKLLTGKRFAVCRGGGQTFNSGVMDRNCLKAYFLEKSRQTPEVVKEMIDRACEKNGWLILATHDVCDRPTQFGCTPQFFKDIVSHAVNSGAELLPVTKAWKVIQKHWL